MTRYVLGATPRSSRISKDNRGTPGSLVCNKENKHLSKRYRTKRARACVIKVRQQRTLTKKHDMKKTQ